VCHYWLLEVAFEILAPAQYATVLLYVTLRASIWVIWNPQSLNFACFTDLAISSILQAMVKVSFSILPTLSDIILTFSPIVPEVLLISTFWPKFYKAQNLRLLHISIRGIPGVFIKFVKWEHHTYTVRCVQETKSPLLPSYHN